MKQRIFSLSVYWKEWLLNWSHLLDPQSVFSWSKILMAVPQRSGLESWGHKVTVGKTILLIGKVSTTDFMGFSIQPASKNFIFSFWFLIPMICQMILQYLPLSITKEIPWILKDNFEYWFFFSFSCTMALQCLKELHLNKKKIIAWNNKIKTTNQEKDKDNWWISWSTNNCHFVVDWYIKGDSNFKINLYRSKINLTLYFYFTRILCEVKSWYSTC